MAAKTHKNHKIENVFQDRACDLILRTANRPGSQRVFKHERKQPPTEFPATVPYGLRWQAQRDTAFVTHHDLKIICDCRALESAVAAPLCQRSPKLVTQLPFRRGWAFETWSCSGAWMYEFGGFSN